MSRVIYGINPVAEALKKKKEHIEKVYYADKLYGRLEGIIKICREKRITLLMEEKGALDRIAGSDKHQGIAAVIDDFKYVETEDILDAWRNSGEKAFILILDGIEDPHNLGAIIRSAESAGVHGIIIPKNRAVSVTSAVEKVSAGAVEHVRIARVTNIARTIEGLKPHGIWIAGAEASEDRSLFNADFNTDIALVIGGESKGVRALVTSHCDFMFSIPMKGEVNSLNASVSSAIVMFEVVRQRDFEP